LNNVIKYSKKSSFIPFIVYKNETVFKIGDKIHDNFYVVASGLIHISLISDAEEKLIEKVNKIKNIEYIFNSKVDKLNGNDSIESITVKDKTIKLDTIKLEN
jgi:CRP-like cAMP-binding protein